MKTRAELSTHEVEQLVAGSKSGDNVAFDQLVDLYRDGVRAFVARRLPDPCEAEDIAQEAFLRAYRGMGAFRGDSSFQSWVHRIASNLAIDSARRHRRRGTCYSLDAPTEREDGKQDRQYASPAYGEPEKDLEAAELRREVHRAILDLSPKLRAVVVLYELKGLTYEDTAATLGCPVGTVKSRLFLARGQLRKDLSDSPCRHLLPASIVGLAGPEAALAPAS